MLRLSLVIMVLLTPAAAIVRGTSTASADVVKRALCQATDYLTSISTEGGYLWRIRKTFECAGEKLKQRPHRLGTIAGTASVGTAFLDAYGVTKDERHLAAAPSGRVGPGARPT